MVRPRWRYIYVVFTWNQENKNGLLSTGLIGQRESQSHCLRINLVIIKMSTKTVIVDKRPDEHSQAISLKNNDINWGLGRRWSENCHWFVLKHIVIVIFDEYLGFLPRIYMLLKGIYFSYFYPVDLDPL